MSRGRPETTRARVRALMQGITTPVSVPEICKALDLRAYEDHSTVRAALQAMGAQVVGYHHPRYTPGRGGSRKPIKLWAIEKNEHEHINP